MTADQAWHTAVQPIVDWCAATPNGKSKLRALMNECPPVKGKQWNRQQVDSYLHPDKRKRQEPRLGAGLAMMAAFKTLAQPEKGA